MICPLCAGPIHRGRSPSFSPPERAMTKRFSTGDTVPETGIYYVYHPAHRLIRTVRLHRGHSFPRCSQCSDQVEFDLMLPLRAHQYKPVQIFELPLLDEGQDQSPVSEKNG